MCDMRTAVETGVQNGARLSLCLFARCFVKENAVIKRVIKYKPSCMGIMSLEIRT